MQRSEITETLSGVLDLERLMAKVSYGTANAKDLLAIGKSLALVPYLREQLADSSSSELCEIREFHVAGGGAFFSCCSAR